MRTAILLEVSPSGKKSILADGPYTDVLAAFVKAESAGKKVAMWPSSGRVKESAALRSKVKVEEKPAKDGKQ